MALIKKFSKQAGIDVLKEKRELIAASAFLPPEFEETAPSFEKPYWAAWWAFRLLHPDNQIKFEAELRDLFEVYKAGKKKWITYNEAKRKLLAKYLEMPYKPVKRAKKQAAK